MTIREDMMRRWHAHVMSTKQRACADGPEDLCPMMTVYFDDGCDYFGVLPQFFGNSTAATVVELSLRALWLEHGRTPLRAVLLVIEGHAALDISEERAKHHHRGDLAREFARNPDADIVEVLISEFYDRRGGELGCSLLMQPYHYDDGGVLVWDDDIYTEDAEDRGAIGAVLRSMCEEFR